MFYVIINPASGQGRARRIQQQIFDELNNRSIAYRVFSADSDGQLQNLVHQAVQDGAKALVCVGGDGTLYEVVNGLAQTSGLRLYLVPCGTGNDFARAMGLPSDPLAAFQLQLDSPPRPCDLGRMNGFYFINVSGLGFDVQVLRATERYKTRFHGLLPYLLGVLRAARQFKPLEVDLIVDGVARHERLTLMAVANGQYIGGGMRVAPGASFQDHQFDLILLRAVPRLLIYLLLPLFMNGSFLKFPSMAQCIRCRHLTVRGKELVVNLDGELEAVEQAEYEILPGAIELCCPEPSAVRKKSKGE